jgi:hypothetical protein
MMTEDLWEKLAEFGVTEIELLKLDCEGAQYTILATLARNGHLANVGWIRGEWHSCRDRQRLAKALVETQVDHIDRIHRIPAI